MDVYHQTNEIGTILLNMSYSFQNLILQTPDARLPTFAINEKVIFDNYPFFPEINLPFHPWSKSKTGL